jgi:hypothetical protein
VVHMGTTGTGHDRWCPLAQHPRTLPTLAMVLPTHILGTVPDLAGALQGPTGARVRVRVRVWAWAWAWAGAWAWVWWA